jgi:hypothetical protein
MRALAAARKTGLGGNGRCFAHTWHARASFNNMDNFERELKASSFKATD